MGFLCLFVIIYRYAILELYLLLIETMNDLDSAPKVHALDYGDLFLGSKVALLLFLRRCSDRACVQH